MLTNREIVDLTEFRHLLHRTPEISGQERETAARVATRLREIGADRVVTDLGGHGVAGVFEGEAPGPTVMLRAELDALPIEETGCVPWASTIAGRAHMCGHDGHSASLLGCAYAFARRPPARGRVVLMFQPAEEDGSGAAAVMADPRFAELRADMAFSWHNMPGIPLGEARFREGPMFCASVGLRVQLEGRTAHASQPETGNSPAQPLAALIRRIAALGPGGPVDEDFALVTMTHARLGEPSFGIAPGRAELQVTLRALMPERMARLRAEAEALARQTAAAAGLKVALDWHDDFACSANDAGPTAIVRRVLDARQVRWEEMAEPYRGSEDFGRFGGTARTAMILLGAGTGLSALHNPDYDFPDDLIPIGAGILTAAAREALGRPPHGRLERLSCHQGRVDDGCCERAADVARHDCHEPCNVRGLLRGGQPVFPPHVGIQAGADRLPGQMDLLIAGMLLPTFGVVALGRGGGTFEPLARPIAPCLGTLLLGPLTLAAWPVTIARTAAVAHEADPALLVAAAADWAGRRFSRSSISSSRCISRSTSAA